jgi:hypothetical protein
MSALKEQVAGQHYKDMAIQPVEYIHKNGLGFIEGCVVKYVSRWREKGGLEDLRKARHFIDMLIEMEEPAKGDLLKKADLDDGYDSHSLHDIYLRGYAT